MSQRRGCRFFEAVFETLSLLTRAAPEAVLDDAVHLARAMLEEFTFASATHWDATYPTCWVIWFASLRPQLRDDLQMFWLRIAPSFARDLPRSGREFGLLELALELGAEPVLMALLRSSARRAHVLKGRLVTPVVARVAAMLRCRVSDIVDVFCPGRSEELRTLPKTVLTPFPVRVSQLKRLKRRRQE
jgi:hypothetical protein